MSENLNSSDVKSELLKNVIDEVKCFNCKDVLEFVEVKRNRYICLDDSPSSCEKCKDKKCIENVEVEICCLKQEAVDDDNESGEPAPKRKKTK